MKFETRSGCKLFSISLCDERKYLGLSPALRNRSFGALTRIRFDGHVWSDNEADWPNENATATALRGEASPLPSSTVEEKTVTEDQLATSSYRK